MAEVGERGSSHSVDRFEGEDVVEGQSFVGWRGVFGAVSGMCAMHMRG